MKQYRGGNIRILPAYVPNATYAMGMEMADRLCEKEEHDPMIMDLLRWNIDHEDMTDESYEWRKMLNLEELKIVGKWDREWCETLRKVFIRLGKGDKNG